MKQNIFFISGIDTGCGKTYITGLLAKQLKKADVNVVTQKLVQTGNNDFSEDILEHRRIMESPLLPEDKQGLTCPYIFTYPASPHLAANLENKTIDIDIIQKATKNLSDQFDIVLCEGAGGLHVPLSDSLLTIEYITKHNYPLILVASSKLGSINHSLLSIESCYHHNINLKMLVYNRFPDDDPVITRDSFSVIKKYLLKKFPQAKIYDTEMIREGSGSLLNDLIE